MTGTSRISFARVAADTNALLSAAADAAAARVFREAADLIVTTTAFNLNETREHLPEIAAHFGIALDKLERALASLPLEVYGEEAYASHLEEARRFLAGRDPDDTVMNRADAKKQREVLAAHPRDTCRPNVSRFSGQRSGPLLKCFVLVSCATRFEPAAQRILTLA